MCCFLKYSIAVFSVIIALAGVGLITIGSLGLKEENKYDSIIPECLHITSIVIIAIGCIVIIIGLAGLCGVFGENAYILITVGIILLLIFVAEVAGAVTIFVYSDEILDTIKNEMNATLYKFEMNDTDIQNELNEIQQNLECCGFSGYEDWAVFYPDAVPKSCCKKEVPSCSYHPLDEESIYTTGCVDQLVKVLIPIAIGVGAALAAVTLAQLLAIVFAWCFAASIKS